MDDDPRTRTFPCPQCQHTMRFLGIGYHYFRCEYCLSIMYYGRPIISTTSKATTYAEAQQLGLLDELNWSNRILCSPGQLLHSSWIALLGLSHYWHDDYYHAWIAGAGKLIQHRLPSKSLDLATLDFQLSRVLPHTQVDPYDFYYGTAHDRDRHLLGQTTNWFPAYGIHCGLSAIRIYLYHDIDPGHLIDQVRWLTSEARVSIARCRHNAQSGLP